MDDLQLHRTRVDRSQIPRAGLWLRHTITSRFPFLLGASAAILMHVGMLPQTNPEHVLLLCVGFVISLLMIYYLVTIPRVTANVPLYPLDMPRQISKQAAAKLLKKVTDLVEAAKAITFQTILMMKANLHWEWGILPHVVGNLSPLRGRRRMEEKVLHFVERETVPSFLGISGMRGVGKTTLLRFVRDSYAHTSTFSYVFFLGAGPGCTVKSLQHALSVNIQMPDVPISACLKGKPFLLLLDDVRERLDLAAVGLPTPLGRRQKVIFTTRNHQICADMGCPSNNTIQMECLSEDDAWDLFKDKVGEENIAAHPHIKHFAKKMAAECRGLPSALCALGRAMSTKTDVKEWRYAYDVLKRKQSPVSEIQEIDDEGHYSDVYRLQDKL